jgi:hypothetical protein
MNDFDDVFHQQNRHVVGLAMLQYDLNEPL